MNKNLFFLVLLSTIVIQALSQNYPIAVNDTVYGDIYTPITFNVLANDYDPDGDSLIICHIFTLPSNILAGASEIQDSNAVIYLSYQAVGWIKVPYLVCDKHNPNSAAVGALWIKVNNPSFDTLNINNVEGLYNASGSHFWDFAEANRYHIPKNSTKSTLFCSALWIGGKDQAGNIHVAADRYKGRGADFFAGPVSDSMWYTMNYDHQWNTIWKLRKTDIDYHRSHYWTGGYVPIPAIATWPGNGDPAKGQLSQLAPYHDENNNGVYDPLLGEYPVIKGDECLFFVFNDDKARHTETGGRKFGLEIQGMAYAFDCSSDSALNTATFLHYEIINRSDTVYDSTSFGLFVDMDLGYSWDDRVGCDVGRGAFFTYNGRKIDGNGLPGDYGAFPPVQAAVILGGPTVDPDNADNQAYDPILHTNCNEAINGLNFGDGITDNERFGMTGVSYTYNCSSGPTCDPNFAPEYFDYLNCRNTVMHWKYGAAPVNCTFVFPGLSDPCNWGTNGIQPAGYMTGAGGSGLIWTDTTYSYPPDDWRGFMISGPFHFEPGARHQLDVAFVFARNYTDSSATAAFPILNTYIDSIRSYFIHDYTPCGSGFSAIAETKHPEDKIQIYPNPARQTITISYNTLNTAAAFDISDIRGSKVMEGVVQGSTPKTLDISCLENGVYIVSVYDQRVLLQKKVVVLR